MGVFLVCCQKNSLKLIIASDLSSEIERSIQKKSLGQAWFRLSSRTQGWTVDYKQNLFWPNLEILWILSQTLLLVHVYLKTLITSLHDIMLKHNFFVRYNSLHLQVLQIQVFCTVVIQQFKHITCYMYFRRFTLDVFSACFPLSLHISLAEDQTGVSTGQQGVGVPKVRIYSPQIYNRTLVNYQQALYMQQPF